MSYLNFNSLDPKVNANGYSLSSFYMARAPMPKLKVQNAWLRSSEMKIYGFNFLVLKDFLYRDYMV